MFNLLNSITPTPQVINDRNQKVRIGTISNSECSLSFNGFGELFNEAKLYIENELAGLFFNRDCADGYTIEFSINPSDARFDNKTANEGYIIDINENKAEVVGFDEAGMYYAAISFVKLIHKCGNEIFIPCCQIIDYPYFKTRGHFMECSLACAFYSLDDWKSIIDEFAKSKINMMVIGVYGCWDRGMDGVFDERLLIPLKNHPEFKAPSNIKYYSVSQKKWVYKTNVLGRMVTEDYLGDIIAYGKKRNVTVFPLFNSWGHNTIIPRLYPEVSAKNADGSPKCINLCTSNPKTLDMMFSIYDEIIERYLIPNGVDAIHIGLDEVNEVIGFDINNLTEIRQPFCDCEVCRKKGVREVTIEYVINIVKHLKSKGIKTVYMYHDMFAEHDIITDETVKRFKDEGVFDNMVINWWGYADIQEKFFGTEFAHITNAMRGIVMPMAGFYFASVLIDKTQNVFDHRDLALKMDFEGMLSYSQYDTAFDYFFDVYSETAWNPHNAEKDKLMKKYAESRFGNAASDVYNVMKSAGEFMYAFHLSNDCSKEFDYCVWYIRQLEGQEYPHDYPAVAYRVLSEDEDKFITYLTDIRAKSGDFYDFFDSLGSSDSAEMWKLTFLTYKALADEFLTIYTGSKNYNEGKIDSVTFACRLKELLVQREKVMFLNEKHRMSSNKYSALRVMSIHRINILSVLSVVEKDIKNGTHTNIDVLKFREFSLPELEYLR